MRKIFLPTLKKVKISNFTLYPNGLDFHYDFINGINMVIGGNGMGKTTFVNLIKYSIIGHFKKEFDFTRTYKDNKIEKRSLHPINYYKNRIDETIETSSKPSITIEFLIDKNLFRVNRCLETISLNSYSINGKNVEGNVISQSKYETLNNDEKADCLLFKYEQDVANNSGISFDNLIFFVNEILFFGEDHKTILWSDGKSGNDVQNELFNKYFNTPELDKARQEAERQAKYFDSSSRHRSEDIRAIRKVLDKINKDKGVKNTDKSINTKILELKNEIQKIDARLLKTQKDRKKIESDILVVSNRINELSQQEESLEKNKKIAENELFQNKYINLHKSYDLFYKSIKTNSLCPLCSKEVDEDFTKIKLDHPNNCILCDQEINHIDDKKLDDEFTLINNQLRDEHIKIRKLQKDVIENEKKLEDFDTNFNDLSDRKRKLQSELRNLEYANSQVPKNQTDQLQEFYNEINSLEKLKNKFQEQSKIEKLKAERISKEIENEISSITKKFSLLFSDYAGEFLGVQCSLTYDDLGDGNKRFYPVIDGKLRQYEEELSESQRFFIDHSFRMSILAFFYTKPTFYIVETPDSSLDISYEKNAAKVFMKFIENDNALILTTNLNNSEFLNHLIELSKNNIDFVNLLEIGKKSVIQKSSDSLAKIYDNIKLKIKK